MKKLFILSALAACSLAACAPVVTPADNPTPTPTPTPSNVGTVAETCGVVGGKVIDEKALIAVETAYNVAAHAYVTLDASGKLSPTLKAKARPALISAYDNLKLARAAYKVGNDCNFNKYAALATSFANYAKGILK